MDKSISTVPITPIDIASFKDIWQELEFKQLTFEVRSSLQFIVANCINQFEYNGLVYQLGEEEIVKIDTNKFAPRRTIVIVLALEVPHVDPSLKYNIALKLSRIYKRSDTISWEQLIRAEVKEALEKHIYTSLCKTLQAGWYQIPGEKEKIFLDESKYAYIHVVKAEDVLEYHPSGYIWLKKELRAPQLPITIVKNDSSK